MRVYLDNAATTPLDKAVLKEMYEGLTLKLPGFIVNVPSTYAVVVES